MKVSATVCHDPMRHSGGPAGRVAEVAADVEVTTLAVVTVSQHRSGRSRDRMDVVDTVAATSAHTAAADSAATADLPGTAGESLTVPRE
ncbi:MAG: hypothetical protein ABIQ18_43915 [Umezawaea sp.]